MILQQVNTTATAAVIGKGPAVVGKDTIAAVAAKTTAPITAAVGIGPSVRIMHASSA